jgi:hypothetical protein
MKCELKDAGRRSTFSRNLAAREPAPVPRQNLMVTPASMFHE